LGPQNQKVWESLAQRIKTVYFVLLGKWKLQNDINKLCVHWMDRACLFNKICGYGCCKKGVCIQVCRSTARRYFLGQQHGPTWKCIQPKNKPTKNSRNHGNLTKRTSGLHERTTIPRKYRNAVCSGEECRKGVNFCCTFKAFVEPKLAQHKIYTRGALHIRVACVHAFQTNGQIGHTCLGPQN